MNLEARESEKLGIASLIKGIITDARNLFAKELIAARLEIQEELVRMKNAALLLGVGLAVVMVGCFLLAMMLTYLMQTYTGIQLWQCYGIVGLAIILIGAAFIFKGRSRATGMDLKPTEAVEGAKEDIRWLKRKVTSGGR